MERLLQSTWEFIFMEVSFCIHPLERSANFFSYPFSRRFTKSLSVSILSEDFRNLVWHLSSRRFSQILFVSILSKIHEILRISLREGCCNLPYQYSQISSKYFRTVPCISGVTNCPRVSPKLLRTHLCISVVIKFPRVSQKFLPTPSWYLDHHEISSYLLEISSYASFVS